jgi:hypothetical protein
MADDAGADMLLEAATRAVNKAKEAEGKGEVVACGKSSTPWARRRTPAGKRLCGSSPP